MSSSWDPQAALHRPDRPHRLLAPLPARIPGKSRHCSLYTLRTDARDRLGTPLERSFSRTQIRQMCSTAGLVNLRFSPRAPCWCVAGAKGDGTLASTAVLLIEQRGLCVGRVLVFDLQGSITLLAGALIALITLFTSYGHVDIPSVGSIQLNQQGLFR